MHGPYHRSSNMHDEDDDDFELPNNHVPRRPSRDRGYSTETAFDYDSVDLGTYCYEFTRIGKSHLEAEKTKFRLGTIGRIWKLSKAETAPS